MFELFVELNRKWSPSISERGCSLFCLLFVGPLFLLATLSLFLFPGGQREGLWLVGWSLSLFLGFFLTFYGTRQGFLAFAAVDQSEQDLQASARQQQAALERLQQAALEDKQRLSFRLTALQQQLKQADDHLLSYKGLFDEAKLAYEEQLASLHGDLRCAAREVDARIESEKELRLQLQLHRDLLAETTQKWEIDAALLAKIEPLEEEKRAKEMLRQLRSQFEEKRELLDQTRKELFQAQERVLFLERSAQEKPFLPSADHDLFIESWRAAEERVELLQEECALLQELLVQAYQQPKRAKRASVKLEETLVADLFPPVLH